VRVYVYDDHGGLLRSLEEAAVKTRARVESSKLERREITRVVHVLFSFFNCSKGRC
jgi:hypothetical protein